VGCGGYSTLASRANGSTVASGPDEKGMGLSKSSIWIMDIIPTLRQLRCAALHKNHQLQEKVHLVLVGGDGSLLKKVLALIFYVWRATSERASCSDSSLISISRSLQASPRAREPASLKLLQQLEKKRLTVTALMLAPTTSATFSPPLKK
jgi:hypothetical protein